MANTKKLLDDCKMIQKKKLENILKIHLRDRIVENNNIRNVRTGNRYLQQLNNSFFFFLNTHITYLLVKCIGYLLTHIGCSTCLETLKFP